MDNNRTEHEVKTDQNREVRENHIPSPASDDERSRCVHTVGDGVDTANDLDPSWQRFDGEKRTGEKQQGKRQYVREQNCRPRIPGEKSDDG